MNIEDLFSGQTSGLIAFDMETLVENHLRQKDKEEDYRGFKYEDSVLRPRHIIDLHEQLRNDLDRVFLATAPVVMLDGKTIEMKSYGFDSFLDLTMKIDDLLMNNRYVVLYRVIRNFMIDPGTFDPTLRFMLRCGH